MIVASLGKKYADVLVPTVTKALSKSERPDAPTEQEEALAMLEHTAADAALAERTDHVVAADWTMDIIAGSTAAVAALSSPHMSRTNSFVSLQAELQQHNQPPPCLAVCWNVGARYGPSDC
mmetsp:Transcript_1388/g.1866  ORF Transcript_1388/g.1866 Transcript_1388/m.1866 type:complete len:121 (-) Transcript_1388:202-564(-)